MGERKKEKLNLKRFILKLLSLLGYDCSRVDIAPLGKGKKGSQKLSIALAVIYAAVSWVTLSRDNILAELIAIILNGITVIQVLIALYQKSDAQQARLKGKQETYEENPYQEVNSTPFVRQYGILSNKWGVLLCQKEYQTNDIRRSSRKWL